MNFPSYKRIKKEFDIILDRYQNCSIIIDNDNKYQNYILTVKLKDPKVDIVFILQVIIHSNVQICLLIR